MNDGRFEDRVRQLMTRDRKQHDIETKLLIVWRHLQGVSGRVLAKEYDLPSPGTVTNWTRIYPCDGEDGLRPKKRGRPPVNRENPLPETEVEQLRRENERLRAEVAYLGKLRDLRATGTTLKVQAIDDVKAHYRLPLLLHLAKIPRSTFYDHRNRLTRPDRQKPYAFSACLISQVSWKLLMKLPGSSASAPAQWVPGCRGGRFRG